LIYSSIIVRPDGRALAVKAQNQDPRSNQRYYGHHEIKADSVSLFIQNASALVTQHLMGCPANIKKGASARQ
jgi:hypothetical protein